MALFRTYSLVLCCSDVATAKQWWIETFNCKPVSAPCSVGRSPPIGCGIKATRRCYPEMMNPQSCFVPERRCSQLPGGKCELAAPAPQRLRSDPELAHCPILLLNSMIILKV